MAKLIETTSKVCLLSI